jgi:DNA-binding SARP family transcriptional activator
MRVYLTGEIVVEGADRVVGEAALPGLQGRVVLAMLAAEHRRRVPREELADELWGDARPAAWEAGLRALVSKARAAVAAALPGWPAITTIAGCHRFHLPPGGAIDIEIAHRAVHDAEAELGRGNVDAAGGAALVASMITRRPFLIGADGPWARARREHLQALRVRALEALAVAWACKGDHEQAARDAGEAARLDPFRETAHQKLIQAHAAAGNPARAIAAYRACRAILRDELGVEPSPETEAVYRRVTAGSAARRP